MKQPTTRSFSTLLAATLAMLLLAMTPLTAQDAAKDAPQEAAAPASPPKKEMTFLQMLEIGGWTMWPLGLCSVAGVALIIWNGMIVRPSKMLDPTAVFEVNTQLAQMDIAGARSRCERSPGLATNVISAGLSRVDDEIHLSSVEKGMEEAAVEEIGNALVPINYISAVAVVAPMLGLLGTVSGMINAFRAMAVGGMGRPELLADNISEALITTATGLIIGIPTMVAYLYFKNKFTTIVARLSRITGNSMETLSTAVRRAQYAAQHQPEAVVPPQEMPPQE